MAGAGELVLRTNAGLRVERGDAGGECDGRPT